MKTLAWIVLALFATSVGIYPVLYFITDMSQGLLSSKPEAVLNNPIWNIAFKTHIVGGGIGLLVGWVQFVPKFRNTFLHVHRTLGKIYVVSCVLSGIAALYLAVYATGGLITSLGFGSLALLWLFCTSKAYLHIRARRLDAHQAWMIRSYALTFAAVTLRIWNPIGMFVLDMDFISSYQMAAWLCWVPNLIVAEIIVRRLRLA